MTDGAPFPVTVKITTAEQHRAISALAEANGFAHVQDYVQHVVEQLGAVTEPLDQILRLHAEGRTTKQIAEVTGQTVAAIRDRLARAGRRSNPTPRSVRA